MIAHKGYFDMLMKVGIRFVLIKSYVCLLNCFLVIGGVKNFYQNFCCYCVMSFVKKNYWLCTKERKILSVWKINVKNQLLFKFWILYMPKMLKYDVFIKRVIQAKVNYILKYWIGKTVVIMNVNMMAHFYNCFWIKLGYRKRCFRN